MADGRRPATTAGRILGRVGAGLGLVLVLALTGGSGHVGPTTGAGRAAGATPPLPTQLTGEDGPQLPGAPPSDPATTRERADEILARDEYQGPQDADDTFIDRIRRWLEDLWPEMDGPDVGSGLGNAPAFVIAGIVVVGAAAAAIWTLTGARRTRRPDEEVDAEVDITPLRSADEWADEAERCLRAGDHRGAVRARYRSLTATLARRGLVADTPGRTAGEQRDDVAERAPGLTPAFAAVADLFERVWFGAEGAGPAESEAAQDLAARALADAPRRAATADDDPTEAGR